MDYSKLTPLLVQAVNALRAEKNAQISAQQAQIDVQKKVVDRQNARIDALTRLVCASNKDADICKEQ